jgi:predicted acylesterase/phospholipase RssA
VLQRLPLFADLSAPLLAKVLAASDQLELPAGQYLFRAGEPGDGLCVLLLGRVAVLASDGTTLRTLYAGDAVGEFGVLTGAARTADVRAVRDCRVLRVPQRVFIEQLSHEPELFRALAAMLSRRAVAGMSVATPTRRGLGLATAVSLHPSVDDLLQDVPRLTAESAGPDWPTAVANAEEAHPDLLLHCPSDASTAWRDFCIRTSDRVIVLGSADVDSDPRLVGADTVAVSLRPGERWPRWAQQLAPARRLRLESASHAGVLTRRVTGTSTGAVLSGGGARGLAHIGVLTEWERSGLWPDRWGGASMGAFVAALAASGRNARNITELCHRELVERRPFRDYALMPRHALLRAGKAREMLRRVFGDRRIEDLPCDYFCVTADLRSGDLVVHREGPLAELVGASMSIPGVAPPVRFGDRLLVDGGVLDNLPVDVMAAVGEGPVIAVDVMNSAALVRDPSILDVIGSAMSIGGRQRGLTNLGDADLVVTPQLDGIGLFDFDAWPRAVAAGRRAAVESLPMHRALGGTGPSPREQRLTDSG